MPEFPPGRGTVCLRGFINLRWNSNQASKNGHCKKRQAAPEVDEGTCRQGQIFLAQPLIGPKAQQVDGPNMLKCPVDVAIRRVKDEPPSQCGECCWGHEGNKYRATEETLPPGGTLQEQGQTQAKNTFEHYRRDGKNNRVAYLDNVTLGRVRWFHLGLQTATGRTRAIDQMSDHKVHRLCGRKLRQGQHRL